MLFNFALGCVALLFVFSSAEAEIYKWVDDKGVVTFKDTPPPASKTRKKVKTYSDSDFDRSPRQQPTKTEDAKQVQAAPAPSRASSPRVELYVTDWCGYCKKALGYLDSKGVQYVTYDIEKDDAAKQRYRELGGNGVPFIVIGSNKISGFSKQALDHYLKQ